VGFDLITQLPKTAAGFDAILVVVCRWSKMVHLVPTTTDVTAEQVTKLLERWVISLHGCPIDLVSDRDTRWTSALFEQWCAAHGIKQRLSTAYHPQTDGQTERVNRVLEETLRHFIAPTLDDWDAHLSRVEFCINNARSGSTAASPFRLVYGRDLLAPEARRDLELYLPSVKRAITEAQEARKRVRECLEAAQQRQKAYADQQRRDVSHSAGDYVMLSTSNLLRYTSGPGRKLRARWIGPYPVEGMVGRAAVRLGMPAGSRMHNVFHVSLLKPYKVRPGETPPPPPVDWDGDEPLWTVAKVLDHKTEGTGRKAVRRFFVRWEGFSEAHDSWVAEDKLSGCQELVDAYFAGLRRQELVTDENRRVTRAGARLVDAAAEQQGAAAAVAAVSGELAELPPPPPLPVEQGRVRLHRGKRGGRWRG
jgi:hypothetical protein